MLKFFMDLKGKMSNRFIRKGAFKEQHFDATYNFLCQEIDRVTERVSYLLLSNLLIFEFIIIINISND